LRSPAGASRERRLPSSLVPRSSVQTAPGTPPARSARRTSRSPAGRLRGAIFPRRSLLASRSSAQMAPAPTPARSGRRRAAPGRACGPPEALADGSRQVE